MNKKAAVPKPKAAVVSKGNPATMKKAKADGLKKPGAKC